MKRILFWLLLMVTFMTMAVLGETSTQVSNDQNQSTKLEPLVYSNSYVYQHKDGSYETKMLTIASGKDGKYHYVKSDGKNVDRGVWKGSLPAMPNVDKIVTQQVNDVGLRLAAVDDLISSFDTSIEKYIKSLVVT